MNDPHASDPSQGAPQGPTFEKFTEPRTFPARWDLSELVSAPQAGNSGNPAGLTPAEEMGEADHGGEPSAWERNPFPLPRTYPANWDLSG